MTNLHLLPWVRTGLSAIATGTPATSPQREIELDIGLTGRRLGGGQDNIPLDQRRIPVQGPGAITGLAPEEILHRDPESGVSQVEPNYFASVELKSADLPWRYTPGSPDSDGRLMPWLALVVVEEREGVTLDPSVGARLARLTIPDAGAMLPPIVDAWAWAHVQYQGDLAGDATDIDTLKTALAAANPALRARLIFPGRLEPMTNYHAAIVPLFEAGRRAGLGEPGSQEPGFAWGDTTGALEMPLYAHWRFSTGVRGDFENLVRVLTPTLAAGTIGLRPLDVTDPSPALPGAESPAVFGGAMVSSGGFQALLKQEVENTNPTLLSQKLAERVADGMSVHPKGQTEDPVVAPPAYGASYARDFEPPSTSEAHWFNTLNTRPEHRIVAALGVEVVRRNQEELMDRAWDLGTGTVAANTQINLTRLAAEVGVAARRRLDALSDADRMRISSPSLAATPGSLDRTAAAQMHASALPNGLFSGAARRITRAGTGLAADGASATPGADLTELFLNNPLTSAGAYRDATAPGGLTPRETPPPIYDPATGTNGMLFLSHPDPKARQVAPFRAERRTEGLVNAVAEAQNPHRLMGRSIRARIPALDQLTDEEVPAALGLKPRFTRPAYQRLKDMSLEFLVPGIGTLPPNTLTLLYANPFFIRAFLAGLNHEMGKEFLWREFPTPLSTTWFRSFWRAGADDIDPIRDWGKTTLGGTDGDLPEPSDLVLVIRGDLPRRFPNLRLYAIEAEWDSFKDADGNHHDFRDAKDDGDVRPPLYAGQLSPDTFFFGFDLGVSQMRGGPDVGSAPGYFFAFEEMPTHPRFGLEVALETTAHGEAPENWSTISWAHVTPPGSADLARFVQLEPPATPWMQDGVPRQSNGPDFDTWAEDSAGFARQTLQRPARVLFHASAMLPQAGDT